MRISSGIRHFLLSNYYTLYYFQLLIDRYRIYYDRNKYRRLYVNLTKRSLQLLQYRQLYPDEKVLEVSLDYPLYIATYPTHLRVQKYFFLCYAVRCFAISFIGCTTDSEQKRIWIGTEFIKQESFYLETTFFFWSAIGFLYLQCCLTRSLLDYKFLTILRLSPNRPDHLEASALDLTRAQLARLHQFRCVAKLFLHASMSSIPIFGPICVVLLYIRSSLYSTHLCICLFWTVILCYWIYAISALLYTNLVTFIIVSKYIHIKQKSIAHSIELCLAQLQLNRSRSNLWRRYGGSLWHCFIAHNVRYTHLQDELQDYNRFWRSYLTFIFVLYVLLIGFILYIVALSSIITLVKFTYGIVLYVNVTILCVIILYGGKVVLQNVRLSIRFGALLGYFAHSHVPLTLYQNVKLNNMGIYLKQAMSGFSLLNGYIITYDTLRLLIVNITIYFILIIKKLV